MPPQHRRRQASIALAFLLLCATAPIPARAAGACEECLRNSQLRQWSDMAELLKQQAEKLRQARQLLDLARAKGDADATRTAEAILAEAEKEWNHGNRIATYLTSGEYKDFLAARADDFDRRVAAAKDRLHRKTDAFATLNKALQQQNLAAVKEMEQQAQELNEASWVLAFDSVKAGLEGTAHLAGHVDAEGLSPGVKDALQKYAHLTIAVPAGAAAHDAAKGELVHAAGELGMVALPIVSALFAGGTYATLVGTTAPAAAVLEFTADTLEVARAHHEFSEAEARQASSLSLQARYQDDIRRIGSELQHLDTQASRAHDMIAAQQGFAAKVAAIRRDFPGSQR